MGDRVPSTYVKLSKAHQAPADDITPGELNQSVDVPQLSVHRCFECGQPLPESYEPPADEDWLTGICGCFEDAESCRTGLFCPCVLFGKNVEAIKDEIPWENACICHAIFIEGGITAAAATILFHGMIDPQTTCLLFEGLLFAWWMCGIYTGLFRQTLQKKHHLKDSPCDPCLVHCFMHWCALCQEHREMKNHLTDDAAEEVTVVSPPPVQEMKSREKRESTASSSSKTPEGAEEHNSMQLALQPM